MVRPVWWAVSMRVVRPVWWLVSMRVVRPAWWALSMRVVWPVVRPVGGAMFIWIGRSTWGPTLVPVECPQRRRISMHPPRRATDVRTAI